MSSRLNIRILFFIYDDSVSCFTLSSSSFIISVWQELLYSYWGNLSVILTKVLEFGTLIRYESFSQIIIFKNHSTVYMTPDEIKFKLQTELTICWIIQMTQISLNWFICFSLKLVFKKNDELQQIHDLSYSLQCSVNAYINLNYDFLKYASIEDILTKIIKTNCNCIIIIIILLLLQIKMHLTLS